MNIEQVFGAQDKEPRSSPESSTVHLSQPPLEHMDIDVGACEERAVEGQHSEYTQKETPIPTVAVESHLEVLGHTTAALGMDSDSLSFRWAMKGPIYTERGDGYYYDVEGVQYRRLGEDGRYTYEQVASVFEGITNNNRVPSPIVDATISVGTRFVLNTPLRRPKVIKHLKSDSSIVPGIP